MSSIALDVLLFLIFVALAAIGWMVWRIMRAVTWLKEVFTPFLASLPNIIRGTDGPPPTPADP